MPPIDLDQNATTPLDPAVLEAMRPYWLAGGNAESRHSSGRAARRGWDRAKETVAGILGAEPSEVVFTSGGTESNNLALFGLAEPWEHAGVAGNRAVTSPFEHPAVAEPLARLEARGWIVDRPPVRRDGVADRDALISALVPGETRLATLILAHNETGAIQPVGELARAAAERGIPVHTDAVQAVGRIPVHFHELGVSTLSASGHKFHGPCGAGLLLVRKGVDLTPRQFGGGQQGGLRPGTAPVALAIGLATALQLWHDQAESRTSRWIAMRDRLESTLIAALGPDRVIRNGPSDDALRLPQTINLGFPGLDGDALLIQLDLAGLSASLGSACASGATQPSPTLLAMRTPPNRLRSSVRFSFGAFTTDEEVDAAAKKVMEIVGRMIEHG